MLLLLPQVTTCVHTCVCTCMQTWVDMIPRCFNIRLLMVQPVLCQSTSMHRCLCDCLHALSNGVVVVPAALPAARWLPSRRLS